jgi:hypothetical protein
MRGLHINCSRPVFQVGDCPCEPGSTNRSFLSDPLWRHPLSFRCQNLCRSNSEVGVIHADVDRWLINEARTGHQIPYYRKFLPRLLEQNGRKQNHVVERLNEIADGYSDFKSLDGLDFGDTIEFACGPYTQVRNIMERVNVTLKSIALLDPILDLYKEIKGTTYYNDEFMVNGSKFSVSFYASTIEAWGRNARHERASRNNKDYLTYDTVVFMNAMIYSLDAIQIVRAP